ncbi:MAG: Uma2 family endonuclease [Dehalococcoidia bacterium]
MAISERTYLRLVEEDPEGKWELHCGALRSKEPMTWEHNDAYSELGFLLRSQLDRRAYIVHVNAGHVYRSATQYYVPDVLVIPTALADRLFAQPGAVEVSPRATAARGRGGRRPRAGSTWTRRFRPTGSGATPRSGGCIRTSTRSWSGRGRRTAATPRRCTGMGGCHLPCRPSRSTFDAFFAGLSAGRRRRCGTRTARRAPSEEEPRIGRSDEHANQ